MPAQHCSLQRRSAGQRRCQSGCSPAPLPAQHQPGRQTPAFPFAQVQQLRHAATAQLTCHCKCKRAWLCLRAVLPQQSFAAPRCGLSCKRFACQCLIARCYRHPEELHVSIASADALCLWFWGLFCATVQTLRLPSALGVRVEWGWLGLSRSGRP